ncbi:MAG TPA: pitrilysin family protein [Anaerolineae bacterium]|nr:pitrilysin family protein [Anaerolineae bacterium]
MEVFTRTLDNGLTVLLRESHHAPVTTFWVWYRVGSRNEVPGVTGIAHWAEHMLFKGSEAFPKGEIDKQIARNGGMMNGLTWLDFTTFFETLPAERADLALRIESDRMERALFEPDEVGLERTVIISERQGAENRPTFLLAEEVTAAAFRVHPYHHETIGDMSDLLTIDHADLWRHYQTYYGPNNAIAVAAGDFESGAMLARIEELFGSLPARDEPPPVTRVEPSQRGERRVSLEGPGTTAYLHVAYHAPAARDADFFPMTVLTSVLSGASSMNLFSSGAPNRSSRLYRALVETGLAAGLSGSLPATLDPYLYSVVATVRSGRTLDELEQALDVQIERVLREPLSTAEVETAVRQAQAQFAYSSDSVTNQGFWLGYASIVADLDWFDTFLARLAAVTPDDVYRVANLYLLPRNRTVGCYLPQDVEGGTL